MASINKDTQSASQTPPPGSYPESSNVNRSPSVASTSVAVCDEVKAILDESNMVSCTFKGEPAWAINKDSWKIVEAKLLKLHERQGNSVPVSEIAELQRELASLRLKANDFKTQNERLEYAQANLTKALNHAKANEAKARIESQDGLALLSNTQKELKATLAKVAASKREYDIAIREAKRAGKPEDVDILMSDKRKLSADLSELNNSLQQTNADRKAIQDKLKRFEKQVLDLTAELNAEKSRNEIKSGKPGSSFAEKARGAKESTIKLYNIAYSNLPSLAKTRFEKIKDCPTDDEKNTVFWLKAAFDATKHAVYRPYKVVFDGLGDDLKAYTVPSRKAFDRFLIAVRDSLLPTGQPLTMDDMNELLGDIEISTLKLNGSFRAKGFKTLKDLNDHDLTLGAPDASDIPFKLVNGKLVPLDGHKKPSGKKAPEAPSFEEDELAELPPPYPPLPSSSESSSDDSDDENDPTSYWIKVRTWLHLQFDSMNSTIRESLRKRPKRLTRYFRLSTGNIFQRFCLVPYSWYIWVFP
ncbi:59 kDa protein [Pleospora typhicola fusarivirus 1]|uniref:59 kDa protein n=1 Tax=Pleospora typhicola fusarivirus 1 TaxID=1755785 RepID=A0A0S2KPY0_9VIRU|nr:59 kDa protein [Pleospora typhicola fusarivirus 1]ALO50137.1 59 kDa protein [Pleospora typhicola fusarivirus 1]